MGLVSSVSLPFAPRLRFTLIPMDAPPYGRAVSDAPPHSGLSPIAVFRHYCSRHLICIVPFTRRGPSLHRHYPASPLLWPHPTPRFAFASARSPKFLSELSTRVPRLYPVRSIRPMSFADARYWLHPIGETGQRIATFTRLRHTVHLRWNSCLRQIRLPHVSRLPHGLSSYSHFDIYVRLTPFS